MPVRKRGPDRIDPKTARLLDANLNRAREGIRVVEDAARFLWDDKALFRRWRSLRHRLHHATALRHRALIQARDSRRDPGRLMAEGKRCSVSDIVFANARRAQEAVRVLEEYSKLFSPTTSVELKAIRYQLYVEEKRLSKKF
ncbi:MAG: thiamine-phosphate pyrophosphorylase [Elusimicrobia bacterium]|nr:thiamine-phosphate pyrophosphorylase [Candidatus Obscuribacterium magneticum]